MPPRSAPDWVLKQPQLYTANAPITGIVGWSLYWTMQARAMSTPPSMPAGAARAAGAARPARPAAAARVTLRVIRRRLARRGGFPVAGADVGVVMVIPSWRWAGSAGAGRGRLARCHTV